MNNTAQNYYKILGININATTEEIKKAYKEIALTCHPDKLINIKDDIEKKRRVEKFKEATIAYEVLMDTDKYIYPDIQWNDDIKWNDIWNGFFGENSSNISTKDILKDAFIDIASSFIKNKIYPKQYYNPTSTTSKDVINHDIKLSVTYDEVIKNVKKKLRLILIDIDEPIFIEIWCGSYPSIVRQYTDDNDIEHEININMEFVERKDYEHIISKDGKIDLIRTVEMNLLEYIEGYERDIEYIDNKTMTITIPPFQKDFYEIKEKGIFGGSLLINLQLKNLTFNNWEILCEKDKLTMIRILKSIYKTI